MVLIIFEPPLPLLGDDSMREPSKNFSADQILDRVRQKLTETRSDQPSMTYLRRTVIKDLDADGTTKKVTRKLYRAFTDGRDQVLLEKDGRPATKKEIEKDRAHNLDRQQKFLHRQASKDQDHNDDLMVKNMDLFRRKFSVRLEKEEKIRERDCYVLQFIPNTEYSLDNRFVDRLMNAVRSKIWVDKDAFRIVRIETKLVESVSFLGGLAGVLRDIEINVDQKPLNPHVWVDDSVSAFFDVRIFFKTFRFRLKSDSYEFTRVEQEPLTTE